MEGNSLHDIMKEYSLQSGQYSDFTQRIESLVRELLREQNISVYTITSRVKSGSCIEAKIQESDGKCTNLCDITDIAGVRVITYSSDEVDRVAAVIREEFDIDTSSSTNEQSLLDPDRFGCLSLNFVIRLSHKRLELSEYRRFSDCKAEIQVRSMLQHSWAEIEQDLGYKDSHAIPKDMKRSFVRLASLLETADIQLAAIRCGLQEYEAEVPRRIDDAPSSVLIDQTSLKYLVENNKLVKNLDSEIASSIGADIALHEEFLGRLVDKLNYFNLTTIADVDRCLSEVGSTTVSFAKAFTNKEHKGFWAGGCLFYMCYILAAKSGSTEAIIDYMERTFSETSTDGEKTASKVMATYKKIAPEKSAV